MEAPPHTPHPVHCRGPCHIRAVGFLRSCALGHQCYSAVVSIAIVKQHVISQAELHASEAQKHEWHESTCQRAGRAVCIPSCAADSQLIEHRRDGCARLQRAALACRVLNAGGAASALVRWPVVWAGAATLTQNRLAPAASRILCAFKAKGALIAYTQPTPRRYVASRAVAPAG